MANDTVSAKLSPGEVVLPKSVMESSNPVKAAAQFVAGLHKDKAGKSAAKPEDEFKQALRKAMGGRVKK